MYIKLTMGGTNPGRVVGVDLYAFWSHKIITHIRFLCFGLFYTYTK